ncbi:hypothetical protein SEA_MAGRITTE_205 [Microbacterium phage Magritte]|nr:hypothetical protein SEA_MAGRITTE_205 [Microbacterium phage Magritte]
MAVVAGVAGHIRTAEKLIDDAHKSLAHVEGEGYGNRDQMTFDIQSVAALGSLAQAHIAMAHFLQFRNDS